MQIMTRRTPWLIFILVAVAVLSLPACLLIGIPSYIPGLAHEDSPFGIDGMGEQHPPYDDRLHDLGVKWLRYAGRVAARWGQIDPEGDGTYNWSTGDDNYHAAYNEGINEVVTIICAHPVYTDDIRKLPSDLQKYSDFIKALASRYDGVVKVWAIENEVDGGFWKDTAQNYALLVKTAYKAVKEVTPDAVVCTAGAASPVGFDDFYIPFLQELDNLRDEPGERFFDVFDFHWTGQWGDNYDKATIPYAGHPVHYVDDYVLHIQDELTTYEYDNVPIWMTEMSQYSDDPVNAGLEFKSEKEHAIDFLKRYVYSLANGVEKVFWVTLVEWFNYGGTPNDYFSNVGLINDPRNTDGKSHKKLAYYTYKLMVEKLEGSDWDNIEPFMEGTNNTYVYCFPRKNSGEPVYAAWWDYFDEPGYMPGDTKTFTLTGVAGTEVTVTSVVPNADTGEDVTNYAAAFTVTSYPISDGSVTIPLGEDPVFVEVE